MNTIYRKYSSSIGNKIDIQVKAFKYADTMYRFLNLQIDNNWQECSGITTMNHISKSGYYRATGQGYMDIKKLAEMGIY